MLIFFSFSIVGCGSMGGEEASNLEASQASNETNGSVPEPEGTLLRIPQDFKDLQTAFNSDQIKKASTREHLIVEIETGHRLASGLFLFGGDYSYVEIKCDGIVQLASSFPSDKHLFNGQNQTRMPKISCLFDMQRRGMSGYVLSNQSSGVISSGAGFKNSGNHTVNIAQSSHLSAYKAIFTDAGGTGVVVQNASSLSCQECDVSRATKNGFQANDGSRIHARNAKADSVGDYAYFAVRSSSLSALNASGRNAGRHAVVVARSSSASVDGGNFDNAGENALYATYGSTISAVETSGINAGMMGIRSMSSSVSSIRGVFTGAGHSGAYAEHIGSILLLSGDASGSENENYDIIVRSGGKIRVDANTSGRLSQSIGAQTVHGIIY